MSKDTERAMNVEELIASAIFHCNYGKRTPAKQVALEFTLRKGIDKYRERAKETLLSLALNDPERLREFANALAGLKKRKLVNATNARVGMTWSVRMRNARLCSSHLPLMK